LGTLASGFSHELNTPLGTVLMCVEGILRESESEWVKESAGIAREQILRCRGITQHFLRLSRGQKGQGDVVDLGAVIASVARLIEPTAREHSVKIEVRPMPEGLSVRADEAEMQHTFINLVLNAVQASRAGGRVMIEADAGVRVRVIDGGCGISEANLKRIFEPFFSGRQGGTGLGLFLSLNFVRRWGGDIRVESQTGLGSTFEVTMPGLSA